MAEASEGSRAAKVGFIYPGPHSAAPARIRAFLEGLAAAGYGPERIEFLARIADGDASRLVTFTGEFVQIPVNVIVAVSTPAARTAQLATSLIPIVAHDLETDPVASGLVASLARPGGNVTGFFFDFPDFRMKLLQLLREVMPSVSRVGVLRDPAAGTGQVEGLETAARLVGFELLIIEVKTSADLDGAVFAAQRAGVGAVVMLSSPLFGANAKRVAELTLAHRLPAVTLFPEFARGGGLMAWPQRA